MLRYTVSRTTQMVVVVFGVVTLVFFILRLASGDPARMMNPPGTPEDMVQLTREKIGTDKPLLVQYWNYIVGLAQGDLGVSFHGGQPVLDELLKVFPNTAMLAVVTILFSSTVALILGIGAALHANGAFDRSVLVYVAVALAIPSFWLGIVLVLIFSIKLDWLPAIDMTGPKSFVLPVITLSVALTPVLIRTIRQSFLETLSDDHIRAARARGIPERRVILSSRAQGGGTTTGHTDRPATRYDPSWLVRRRIYLQLAGDREVDSRCCGWSRLSNDPGGRSCSCTRLRDRQLLC